MRRAARLAAALCALTLAGLTPAGSDAGCTAKVTGASYDIPTDRYPHGALGDPWEWAGLRVTLAPCDGGAAAAAIRLPRRLVFEDVRPLLHDLDGDGAPELLTVESHRNLGARLAVWAYAQGRLSRIAATPHIGQANRWLAQLGAADLDGDGAVEIAYIDRPHLAKTLRIWRYEGGALTEVAAAEGLTNHRFGETEISGGIRDCGDGPEIVTANADWSRLVASRLTGGRIAAREIGRDTGPGGFAAALACR